MNICIMKDVLSIIMVFRVLNKASFEAAYPFGQVSLSDSNLPVKVKVKGF